MPLSLHVSPSPAKSLSGQTRAGMKGQSMSEPSTPVTPKLAGASPLAGGDWRVLSRQRDAAPEEAARFRKEGHGPARGRRGRRRPSCGPCASEVVFCDLRNRFKSISRGAACAEETLKTTTLFKILGEHRVRLRVRFYAALSVEKPWFRGRAALSLACTWHPRPPQMTCGNSGARCSERVSSEQKRALPRGRGAELGRCGGSRGPPGFGS